MHKINYWLSVAVTLSWGYSLFAQDTALHLKIAGKDSTQLTATHCTAHLPSRFSVSTAKGLVGNYKLVHDSNNKHTGMVWIKGGSFQMGASSDQGRSDEYPQHTVKINDFYMDATEVTNAQFTAFVQATGYITMAEKDVNWEEIKKQLPPGTPKPPDSVLKAASLIFVPTKNPVNLQDYSQWWEWKHGADWKHPQGPGSTILGKENYPVVHISWDDAIAYCKWAGKRLPTEAEWEYAARGGVLTAIYPWGNEFIDTGKVKCNSWQGVFPSINSVKDGFEGAAPVQSFASNNFGLYDMAGNVWEWTADFYHHDYYRTFEKITVANSPKGPLNSYDPDEPWVPKRVIRGGSFLCNESYCSGYRVSARMKSSADSGMEHVGFRCVADN